MHGGEFFADDGHLPRRFTPFGLAEDDDLSADTFSSTHRISNERLMVFEWHLAVVQLLRCPSTQSTRFDTLFNKSINGQTDFIQSTIEKTLYLKASTFPLQLLRFDERIGHPKECVEQCHDVEGALVYDDLYAAARLCVTRLSSMLVHPIFLRLLYRSRARFSME